MDSYENKENGSLDYFSRFFFIDIRCLPKRKYLQALTYSDVINIRFDILHAFSSG